MSSNVRRRRRTVEERLGAAVRHLRPGDLAGRGEPLPRDRGATRVSGGGPGDGGDRGAHIEHVTLLATASQTVASGGASLGFDRIEGPPTERRGFETLSARLASSGEVFAIPVDLNGFAILDLRLPLTVTNTGTCTVELIRGATTYTVISASGENRGFNGGKGLWVHANDQIRVTIDPSVTVGIDTSDHDALLEIEIWSEAAVTTPPELGPAIWFRADDLDLSDGAPVTAWNDRSGNDLHAAPDAGQEPTFVASSLNGLPGVQFAADDNMYAALPATNIDAYTIFAVVQVDAVPPDTTAAADDNGEVCYHGYGDVEGYGFAFREDGVRTIQHGGVAYVEDGSIDVGTPHLFTGRRHAGTTIMRVDRTNVSVTNASSTPIAPATDRFVVASSRPESSSDFTGIVYEVIAYAGALSETQLAAVEAMLADRWGL